MALGTPTYFNVFKKDVLNGVHNFGGSSPHTYKLMLSNTAPVATNAVKADITEISAGNGYTAGGIALTSVTVTLSGATATVAAANLTITASGGSIGPFQYFVLLDDTQTSPAKPLVWFAAESAAVTLATGESYTVTLANALSGT